MQQQGEANVLEANVLPNGVSFCHPEGLLAQGPGPRQHNVLTQGMGGGGAGTQP